METRHADNDGSDIFWPGYVDAVTNLVLNLLFLLTIMTVAVFMFALELGRASHASPVKPPVATTEKDPIALSKTAADPFKENLALKREIQRLNTKLAQQVNQPVKPGPATHSGQAVQPGQAVYPGQALQPGQAVHPGQALQPGQAIYPGQAGQPGPAGQLDGSVKTIDVTSNVPEPLNGLDQTLTSDFETIVRFTDEAVAFTPAEHDLLLDTLKPLLAHGKASIHVEVPAGFSEAKRMGFYRAMAVRNLLIEMKIPKDNIDVLVVEGKNNANASLVRVR